MLSPNTTVKRDFYNDPAHGWLKVPVSDLKELGIEHKITQFSYTRKTCVYLEEDVDMTTYAEALRRSDITLELNYHYTNRRSKIRSYDFYTN